MELTASNVRETVLYCLFATEELVEGQAPPDAVLVEGVLKKMGFHPQRLEEKKEDVKSMLAQLPRGFRKSEGGGWSFSQACEREDGVQWGEHPSVDDLFCLGVALGAAGYCMADREMWKVLPGGLPYLWIDV